MEPYKNWDSPAWSELDSQGYCIVENAVSKANCKMLREGILGSLSDAGWKDFKTGKWKLPRNIHGIFHDYNVGYMLDVWAARKMCKHVFASLWGTDELLCSFDGISFVPKGTKWPDVNACWYHVDQGVSKQGLRCIQGLLTLNDMQETDATFSIMPWTQHHHERFRRTFTGLIEPDCDFVRMGRSWGTDNPVFGDMWDFYANKGHRPVRMSASAGSLVLWDSRCVHSNLPPVASPGENERLVVYVCMLPKAACPPEDLYKKQLLFQETKMTSHWPYPAAPFTSYPMKPKERKQILPVDYDEIFYDEEICSLAGLI